MPASGYKRIGDTGVQSNQPWLSNWDLGLWATVFIALAVVVGIGLGTAALPFIAPALLPAIAIAFAASLLLYGLGTWALRHQDKANFRRRDITKAARFGSALMPLAFLAAVATLPATWPIWLVAAVVVGVPSALAFLRGTIFRNVWAGKPIKRVSFIGSAKEGGGDADVKPSPFVLPTTPASAASPASSGAMPIRMSPLAMAIRSGDTAQLGLSSHAARFGLANEVISEGRDTYTPCQYAAFVGNAASMQWLIQNGGVHQKDDLSVADDGKTLLVYAVREREGKYDDPDTNALYAVSDEERLAVLNVLLDRAVLKHHWTKEQLEAALKVAVPDSACYECLQQAMQSGAAPVVNAGSESESDIEEDEFSPDPGSEDEDPDDLPSAIASSPSAAEPPKSRKPWQIQGDINGANDPDEIRRLLEELKGVIDQDAYVNIISHILLSAIENGHSVAVQPLLDAGASVEPANQRRHPPLYLAAEKGDVVAVMALLRAGANPAAISQVKEIGELCTALQVAVEERHEAIVDALLARLQPSDIYMIGDVRRMHRSALYRAIVAKNTELVKKLVKAAGDNPAPESEYANYWYCVSGAQPFSSDLAECVYQLTHEGEGLDHRGRDGVTVLHRAAYQGHADFIRWVTGKKKDLLAMPDSDGNTPLHYGLISNPEVKGSSPSMAWLEAFMDAGAPVSVPNNKGKTVADLVVANQFLPEAFKARVRDRLAEELKAAAKAGNSGHAANHLFAGDPDGTDGDPEHNSGAPAPGGKTQDGD